jgi:hypothetical protein
VDHIRAFGDLAHKAPAQVLVDRVRAKKAIGPETS